VGARLQNGQSCSAKVISVKEKIAELDFFDCPAIVELQGGQVFTYQAPVKTFEPLIDDPQPKRIRVAMSAFYNTASTFFMSKITSTSASGVSTGTGEMGSEPAGGAAVEAWYSRLHNWGASAGLAYEGKRNINTFSTTSSGVTTTATYAEPKPSVTILDLYVNAVYRWETYYAFAGGNFSLPNFNRGAGAIGTFDFRGYLGEQIGGGAALGDHFATDLTLKIMTFYATGSSGSTTVDYGLVLLTGLQLQLKYIF
jgi:hypothetical protein